MYVDKELELSSEQAVTASAASTNYIDQGAAMDAGMSQQKHLAITVDVAADSAANGASVTFQLQCDSDSAFGSAKTVAQSGAIAEAELVAGKQVFIPLPVGLDERYIRLYYSVSGENLTAGKFTAQIVEGIQKNDAYADAL